LTGHLDKTMMVTMKTIGVAELKTHLSRYLDLVKGGAEVVVTERGVAVAKLVPLRGTGGDQARRQRLARTGALQLGSGRLPPDLLRSPKGRPVGALVLEALLEERREGR
jgi:prevent-host-death family protein